MKHRHLYLGTSSRNLLIQLLVVHLFGTIFAYTVYLNFSTLGDGYLPGNFWTEYSAELSPTKLIHGIYGYLGVGFPGFLGPMLLGQVVAILIWQTFRDVYRHISPLVFWTCNLSPHFLFYSGVSSKEQIMIICGLIVINFAAKRSFAAGRLTSNLIFVFIALWVIFYVRPNYFVVYLMIFITAIFTPWLDKIITKRFSVGLWVLAFILAITGLTLVLSLDASFFSEKVVIFMKRVEWAFLAYDAGSNRTNFQWIDIWDLLYNSLWGIPQGFIGPTLIEVILKPVQFPVFLEGIVYLYMLCFLFVNLFKLAHSANVLRVHILPYIFVAFTIVFVSYPYLIFNAGSALRIKQSMHPFLIFYPLLILAYHRAKTYNED